MKHRDTGTRFTPDPASDHRSHSRSIFYTVAPAILVVSPLVGLAFQSDQRVYIYFYAAWLDANPIRIIQKVTTELDFYLTSGNFRPIGRSLIYLEESARFDIATATGIPPHIVQGGIRVIMIALLALVATRLVSALYISAQHGLALEVEGKPDALHTTISHPVVEPFPIILASTLIVAGTHHPIALFPFFLIGNAIVLLWIPILVASDRAILARGITKGEIVLNTLLGLIAAMTYELLYLLPLVCLIVVYIRAKLAGLNSLQMLHSSAFSRLVTLSIGFLLIFLPSRVLIATRCSLNDCYEGSEIVPSGLSVLQWFGRTTSGLPLFYPLINRNAPEVTHKDLDIFVENIWLTFSIIVLVLFTLRAVGSISSMKLDSTNVNFRCLSLANMVIGLSFMLLPSLMISLSENAQHWHVSGWGMNQWRDSLLVQVGTAFFLYSILLLVFSVYIPHRPRRLSDEEYALSRRLIETIRFAAVVLVVFLLVASALASNSLYAANQRASQYGNYQNLISTATVEFDDSELGRKVRCQLATALPEFRYDKDRNIEALNELARAKYGSEFCLDADQETPDG